MQALAWLPRPRLRPSWQTGTPRSVPDSRRAIPHPLSRPPEPPTLEDVARRSGVSTATVSRCLNVPERVAPATRERVERAVAALGYTPNFGARALMSRRTDTFGAVIPTLENAIFARGLQAFQEALVARGATLLVASSSYDPAIEASEIRALVARGAEGLLLIGTDRAPGVARLLERRRTPVVVAWTWSASRRGSCVGFDNAAASRGLAARALELGHRRFAYVSAARAGNDRARERVAGAARALADAGLDPGSMPVIETVYSIEAGGDAFEAALARSPRPSVVMCGNDVLAVGAVRRARALGLDVPGDVSITGFDDIELATVVEPALTTVHVPHREMGRRAAELLFARAREGSAHARVRLDTRLVERESLGPPPSRGAGKRARPRVRARRPGPGP